MRKRRIDRNALNCLKYGLLLGCLLLMARPVWAQADKKITISLEQQPLSQSLKQLQEASQVIFAFDEQQLKNYTSKAARFTSQPLPFIVNTLLKETSYTFQVINGSIVIVQKPAGSRNNIGPGKVTGFVMDEEDGQPVTGATIRVAGKTIAADLDGHYAIQLPKGTYEAEVDATGYGKKIITEIKVNEEQFLELNISLKRQKGQLAGVTVRASARQESVAALFIRQKNAAAISDGISAEQISRTPDKNIGEVLKRVNGVGTIDNKFVVVRGLGERYNGSMLNNQLMPSTELNRKQFSFDIIPSNLVDNVVVYKTTTPDVSAEFGGGLISINTKALPSENFLDLTVGAAYDDKTTGKAFTGFEIENKQYLGAIPDHRKLMGRSDWNSRSEAVAAYDYKKFSNNWQLYRYSPKPSQNYQLSGGRLFNLKGDHRIGLIGSVSYRNTWQTQDIRMGRNGYDAYQPSSDPNELGDRAGYTGHRYGFTTNIGLLAGAGYQHRNTKLSWQSLYLITADQQLILGNGYFGSIGNSVGLFDLYTHTRLWQHQLKGEHQLSARGLRLNWMGSYINMDRQKPDNHNFNALYANDGKDNPYEPVDFSIQGAQSDLAGGAYRGWNRAVEKNYNWSGELAQPFRIDIGRLKSSHTIKAGYAGWYKDRSFLVLNTSSGYSINGYQPLSAYFDASLHPDGQHLAIGDFGDDMKKQATLHAGYAMLDQKFGKRWRLVWGLRAEYYNLNKVNQVLDSIFARNNRYRGNNEKYDYSELTSREPNWNFFPSANLTFNLTPKMNLRLAYAKSIIRPDLREMSYFLEYDFELGGIYQSESPVRSTILHHYDLRYEWYPGPGEIVSVSLFYKNIDYPMEIYKQGDNRIFTLQNNKSAKNKGIEVELRKSMAFTGVPVLKNITFSGNGTWLDARVRAMTVNYTSLDAVNPLKIHVIENVGPEEKRPQSGASNYMVNAGMLYESKWFSLSGSYNYVSNRMFRPSIFYQESLFERPLTALDAQLSANFLKKRLLAKLTVSNLLGSKSLVYRNFYADPDITNGGKAPSTKDLLYQRGDGIDYEATPGRVWSLQFTYHF